MMGMGSRKPAQRPRECLHCVPTRSATVPSCSSHAPLAAFVRKTRGVQFGHRSVRFLVSRAMWHAVMPMDYPHANAARRRRILMTSRGDRVGVDPETA